MAVLTFPDGFLWGTATAAYQIEGSPLADGAGPSIWHTFAHSDGAVQGGETADVACDHYNRYEQDVALMAELGAKAYRFSVSWSRIFPEGKGALNQAGLDFYRRLVDALLDADIVPVVTLYHWDLPQALEDLGGWPNPDVAQWYADYAATMFQALGDRVPLWITINEPWEMTFFGYGVGMHAPGRADMGEMLQAGHTVLRAHGLAVQRFRELVPDKEIGITLSAQGVYPDNADDPRDVEAAERLAAFHNFWFSEPIFNGVYPQAMYDQYGDLMPRISEADAAIMTQPTDFLGLNYYSRDVVRYNENGFFKADRLESFGHRTALGLETYAPGQYQLLKTYSERYGLPMYVTENGPCFDEGTPRGVYNETPDGAGHVNDEDRVLYLQHHFDAAHRAICDGVDLRGYFVWTFIDNFEWASGFSKRFGLVRCDFATQQRTIKQSGHWFKRVIAENGI